MKPKIRFKGYEGEWKEYSFSDILIVNSGKDYKHLDNGIIPVYGTGGYMLSVNESLSDIDAIGIGRKGTIDKPQYLKAPFWTVDTLFFLTTKNNDNLDFLYNLSQNIKWKKYDESTGVPSLSKTNIDKIETHIPYIAEQQEIASYFTSLDSQISASTSRLTSLKQMKAASLQAMFPQEGETVPKIRFKGFEEEWKKVKLNSFAKRVTRKNSHLESTLALTIASAHGLVSQIDYFNNLVVGSNIRNYYLLKKGEFAYNKSYSNGYPFGSVKRLERYEQGILSTLYITFSIDNSISSDYLTHFFDTNLWHKEVAERAAEGARNHGLLNIGANDFLDINIWKPESKAEQQAIASYFTSLDRQISLQSQRLEKLKQIKSACLDKMFV